MNTYQDIPYVTRNDLNLTDLDEAIRLHILVRNIEIWMKNRGLDARELQLPQTAKLISEVAELCENAAKGKDVLDDVGDVIVVAIGAALRNGSRTVDAIECAFKDIKDRKGRMIGGIFVKEADLNSSKDIEEARCKATADEVGGTYLPTCPTPKWRPATIQDATSKCRVMRICNSKRGWVVSYSHAMVTVHFDTGGGHTMPHADFIAQYKVNE